MFFGFFILKNLENYLSKITRWNSNKISWLEYFQEFFREKKLKKGRHMCLFDIEIFKKNLTQLDARTLKKEKKSFLAFKYFAKVF